MRRTPVLVLSTLVLSTLVLTACQPAPTPTLVPTSSAPVPSQVGIATPGATTWSRLELPQVDDTTQIGAVLADDNGFVLAGGINDTPAAWTSPDGVDWTVARLPGAAGVTPTSGYAIDGRMVLLGGGGTERCAHPAMAMSWARPAGGEWESAPFDRVLCGNPYVADLVSNGTAMLLVGTGFGEVGLSWASDDGLRWIDVAPRALQSSQPRAAVWTGSEYVVLAVGDPDTDVWTSADGRGWSKTPDVLPGALSAASMAALDGTVVAVIEGDDGTATWTRAADGSWSAIDVPGIDPGVTMQTVHVLDGRFVFLASGNGHPIVVTWRPGDPTASLVAGPDDAIDLIGFAVRRGTLVVLGGVGTLDERHPAAWSTTASALR